MRLRSKKTRLAYAAIVALDEIAKKHALRVYRPGRGCSTDLNLQLSDALALISRARESLES